MAEPFDLESVYDEEIQPLMEQILEICQRVQMPMVATFLYGAGNPAPEVEDYCTSCLQFPGRECRTIDYAVQLIQRGVKEEETLRIQSNSIAMTFVQGGN